MRGTTSTPWVIGAALASVLILVATWLLGVSPRLDAAADHSARAESARARADLLQIELAQLEKDYANIEQFRGELALLREQIPAGAATDELGRQVEALATTSGVTILSLSPQTPVALAVEDANADAAAAEPAVDGGTAGAETAAAAPATSNIWAVPFEMSVLGGLDETLAFLEGLQTGGPRLVLVTSLTATARQEQGAQDGLPAIAAGWIETKVAGFVYVIPDAAAGGSGTEEESMPVPAGQPNPFAATS